MKKIILIFAVFAFGAASGQQKDLFDIDAFLQKKTALQKKQLFATPNLLTKKVMNYNSPSQNRSLLSFPDISRIRLLPQDNMPCIIPDMSEFNMPNAANRAAFDMVYKQGYYPGKIPNAAQPGKISPPQIR